MKTKKGQWSFDGQSVLDSNGDNACVKKNGNLIAAAPELLEALKMAMDWVGEVPAPYREFPFIAAARKAIARATA